MVGGPRGVVSRGQPRGARLESLIRPHGVIEKSVQAEETRLKSLIRSCSFVSVILPRVSLKCSAIGKLFLKQANLIGKGMHKFEINHHQMKMCC